PWTFSSFAFSSAPARRRVSTSIAPCTTIGRGADSAADGAGAAASRATQDAAKRLTIDNAISRTPCPEPRRRVFIDYYSPTLITEPATSRRGLLYADVIGGVTTFFTMAYIVVVNPAILSTEGTGLPFAGAPGMGLNAFFAFTIVLQNKVPWPTALGMVFWAGVLFLAISTTPVRERIAMAIPIGLRAAAAGGIGLLLTFIGLRNTGLVAADPVTIVRAGTLDHRAVFLVAGVLVAAALMRRHNPLAFLAAIFSVTAVAWALGYAAPPARIVSPPDFSSAFLKLDIPGALRLSLLPAIVAILFTDLFDSLSTFIGVAKASGLTDRDGRPINLRRGLIVDAVATTVSGLAGTSPGTAYVESIAGIRMGAMPA